MDATFELLLECGHKTSWQEPPDQGGGGPWVGLLVWCPECQQDQEIAECDPLRYYTDDVLLTETEPRVVDAGASGQAYTEGERAAVFYYTGDGTWGYHTYGVADGISYESDDVTGFENPKEALEDLANWLRSVQNTAAARKVDEYLKENYS